MRTLLQKLKFCAEVLPILMLVLCLQVQGFGQCDVIPVGDCAIEGCSDSETLLIPVNPATGACDQMMYNFPTTMSGTGDCTTAGYYVALVDYTFYQYGSPVSSPTSFVWPITNGPYTFNDGPGRYVLIYNLLENGTNTPLACCTSELILQVESSIACNDQIQVTMDANCNATISLDMVLEGTNDETCFADFYQLSIPGFANNADGTVTIDTPGSYDATIITPTGEQCWGTVLVEDKVNALLTNCMDFEVFCNHSIEPGAPILDFQTAETADINMTIPPFNELDGVPGIDSVTFDFTTAVGANQTVIDINEIAFEILSEDAKNIKLCLKNPNKDSLEILDLFTGNSCANSDLQIALSDDAFLTHNILTSAANCGLAANHAYCGDYQPLNELSFFNGDNLYGEWVLIVKNFDPINSATVVSASMDVTTSNETVPYPFDGDVTVIGPNEYSISLPDNNCGPYIATYVDEEISECGQNDNNEPLRRTIKRTWSVVSQSSGVESMCMQNIFIRSFDINELILPPNYDGFEYVPFFCSQFFDPLTGSLLTNMLTPDSLPLPTVTGYVENPFGETDICDNFGITYEDLKLPICGKFSYKALRTWTIVDWCTGEVRNDDEPQVIKVIDNEPPVVTVPQDTIMVFTDGGFECTGDLVVPPPLTVFDCGFSLDPDLYTFDVEYKLADPTGEPDDAVGWLSTNVFDTDGDGNPDLITDLPLGLNWIRYTVVDDCGNLTHAFNEVRVKDNTSPHPVCVEFLVLSLGSDGCAHAGAASFDKGSWDNCGIAGFEVRKYPSGTFGPYVEYCCTDLGVSPHEVELLVIDLDGNTNTCIVEVQLQNPYGIIWNETADPVYFFDCEDELPSGDDYLPLFEADQTLDDIDCPLTITFDGPKVVSDFDDCGNAIYEIVYTASNGISDDINYTVRLDFSNGDPFDPDTDVNWGPLGTNPITVDGCPDEMTLESPSLGYPTVTESPCGLTAITYDDQVFDDVENACLKVLRTWTVIDWCTYDPETPNENVAEYVQVIKINDIELPEFNCAVGNNVIEGEEDACELNTTSLDTDEILILDETEGWDACSEMLDRDYTVEYEIDYNRDGSIDASGTGRNANGIHDYGLHTITWTITDHCGNVNSCTYNFEIRDSKPPTPYCLSSVVTVTMPEDAGSVEVWANDFDLGSTDNVTGVCNDNPLTFTLVNVSTGEQGSVLSFDCDDIPNGISQDIILQMHVADEFGNSDFCEVILDFQDNENDACEDDDGGGASRTVSGQVYTEDDKMMNQAMVQIYGDNDFASQMMTPSTGTYLFEEVPVHNDYEIVVEKQDSPTNGVSTLDLVLIQKHILDIQQLSTPYKMIAADANRSGGISSIDLITIRKIILGIEENFPNDDMPWRFVDADQTFADEDNPFPYDESVNISDLNATMLNNDFIAVKIGDVNGSATIDGFSTDSKVEERSLNTVQLSVVEASFNEGDLVEIPVTAANFNEIVGTQFTIQLNNDLVQYDGITAGVMNVNDANFGYNYLSEGYITASWNTDKAVSADANDVLFTINATATTSGKVSNVLSVGSAITSAEAYNSDLETMGINLSFEGLDTDVSYELYQNVPNPFGNETSIRFKTPVDGPVVLTIFDVNGRVISSISQNYNRGINSIELKAADLKANGIFYYQMEAEGFTATRKMIVLK